MRRILPIFGMIVTLGMVPGAGWASIMCAADDWVVVALDPAVNGTKFAYDNALFEWSATFDYGTVWGIATCMDVAGNTNTPVVDLRGMDGELATGDERKGSNCWCKMTHPAPSAWGFRGTYGSVADCGTHCADNCGHNVRSLVGIRRAVFGSVGQ